MFRSLMIIIRELYLYLTVFMLKHSVKLRRYMMWQHVVERHVATSPNLYNDVILPSVLT